MDVRVERALDRPLWRLECLVRAGPREWVPCLEEYRNGRLTTEVGVGSGAGWVGRRVALEVGRPAGWPGCCQVPVAWRAARHPRLFPEFRGVLELTALGSGRTLAALDGGCTAPAGPLGEAADHVVMHRVAEASLHGFLDRIAWVLLRSAPAAAERSD